MTCIFAVFPSFHHRLNKKKDHPVPSLPSTSWYPLGHLPKSSPPSQGGGVEDSRAAKEREWRESFRSQGPGGAFWTEGIGGSNFGRLVGKPWELNQSIHAVSDQVWEIYEFGNEEWGWVKTFTAKLMLERFFFQLGGTGRVVLSVFFWVG